MNIEDKEYILKDEDGNIFLSFQMTDEISLTSDPLLTHCLAVVKVGNAYLLGWNKWRSRYEIFGGCIENGETARECILRECAEELGLISPDIVYLGAMKFLMMPDYFSAKQRIELGGLYGIKLPEQDIGTLYKSAADKDEITKLALYNDIKGKDAIAEIDEKLLEYFK